LYSATCFGCPEQPSSGRCRIHKKNIKGERAGFALVRTVTILSPKNGIIGIILIHKYVADFLRCNECVTVI